MELTVLGLASGYDVEHVIRLFYPMAKLVPGYHRGRAIWFWPGRPEPSAGGRAGKRAFAIGGVRRGPRMKSPRLHWPAWCTTCCAK